MWHDSHMPSSVCPVCSEHELQLLAEGTSAKVAALDPATAQQEMFHGGMWCSSIVEQNLG